MKQTEGQDGKENVFAKLRGKLLFLFGGGMLALSLWVLRSEMAHLSLSELRDSVHAFSSQSILLALFFVAANYFILTLNDWMAIKHIGEKVSYRRVAFASFVSNTIGLNLGMSLVTGGSVRYRIYSVLGISPIAIAKLIAFCDLSVSLGISALIGTTLVLEPISMLARIGSLAEWGRSFGFLLLVLIGVLFFLSGKKISLRIREYKIVLPDIKTMFFQLCIASADLIFASAILYSLLRERLSGNIGFAAFCGIFVLSLFAGVVSQVPGGLGVFDTTLLILLAPHHSQTEIIGGILLFRFLYYILPLLASACLLALFELKTNRDGLQHRIQEMKWIPSILPSIFSVCVFIAGFFLLLSGVTPVVLARFHLLKTILPLPLIQISYFINSFIGVGLLFLAHALARRLRAAWFLTLFFLVMGALFSLSKGLDYGEASFVLILFAALLSSRRYFYRASGWSLRPNRIWIMGMLIVLLSLLWMGMFSVGHMGQASAIQQHLIANGTIVFSLALFSLLFWLHPLRFDKNSVLSQDQISALVAHSNGTNASLAFLGDKRFLIGENARSAIMYAPTASFWIAMGDPIGETEEGRELIWDFYEQADRRGTRAVFYEVGETWLDVYRDLGLQVFKIGEEARVDLCALSENLEGGAWKHLRATCRKIESADWVFSVVEGDERDRILPQLRIISDEWLKSKKGHEKGFSLGFFDEEFLSHFPLCLVEKKTEEGAERQIVAFCNIWTAGTEMAIDLMRHTESAPPGIMDFLFGKLMLWGKGRGFVGFSMGMAPLSGMDEENSLFAHMGNLIYRHGEFLYHFQGLRHYKEKFNVSWQPRYLVCSSLKAIPLVLVELAWLISKGKKLQGTKHSRGSWGEI